MQPHLASKEGYNKPCTAENWTDTYIYMTIEVKHSSGDRLEAWNEYVDQSPHGDLLQYYEALQIQAQWKDCSLHTLLGLKGEEPVGIFPLFEIEKGPFRTVFSPPPDLQIPYQGPALLNMGKLKQRKKERRHRSFLQACCDWIDSTLNPRYTHVRLHGSYPDLRPLKWEGFDIDTSYTYLVDLTPDEDALLSSFSSDARTNICQARDATPFAVRIGTRDSIRRILDQVRHRYEEQGIAFHLSDEFVLDLYETLPDGSIRPYVCRVDDEFVGGILAYEYDDTIFRWQGGVCPDWDADIAINDFLDWNVMLDAKSRGISTYDLVGAETPRINEYKAKFNPTLEEYYTLEKGTTGFSVAAHLYKQFRSSTKLSPK